jgi:ABC-type oligopeptide transport system substrate-binding subunit
MVYDTLLATDSNFKTRPQMADWKISDDKLTYTFILRSAIPPQVTAVKFQSDLTEASAVHAAELARASDLWRSLLPTQPGPSR